jgi:hypothetical protein
MRDGQQIPAAGIETDSSQLPMKRFVDMANVWFLTFLLIANGI